MGDALAPLPRQRSGRFWGFQPIPSPEPWASERQDLLTRHGECAVIQILPSSSQVFVSCFLEPMLLTFRERRRDGRRGGGREGGGSEGGVKGQRGRETEDGGEEGREEHWKLTFSSYGKTEAHTRETTPKPLADEGAGRAGPPQAWAFCSYLTSQVLTLSSLASS